MPAVRWSSHPTQPGEERAGTPSTSVHVAQVAPWAVSAQETECVLCCLQSGLRHRLWILASDPSSIPAHDTETGNALCPPSWKYGLPRDGYQWIHWGMKPLPFRHQVKLAATFWCPQLTVMRFHVQWSPKSRPSRSYSMSRGGGLDIVLFINVYMREHSGHKLQLCCLFRHPWWQPLVSPSRVRSSKT